MFSGSFMFLVVFFATLSISCFLLDGFVPFGGFFADQKPAKFCPSIRARARGDTQIFMPD